MWRPRDWVSGRLNPTSSPMLVVRAMAKERWLNCFALQYQKMHGRGEIDALVHSKVGR